MLTTRQAYPPPKMPEHLVVIGSGVTGVEFVHMFSSFGAKVGLDETGQGELLEVGRTAHLRLEPPGARPVEVEAIVWRTDDDGPVFFFIGTSPAA